MFSKSGFVSAILALSTSAVVNGHGVVIAVKGANGKTGVGERQFSSGEEVQPNMYSRLWRNGHQRKQIATFQPSIAISEERHFSVWLPEAQWKETDFHQFSTTGCEEYSGWFTDRCARRYDWHDTVPGQCRWRWVSCRMSWSRVFG